MGFKAYLIFLGTLAVSVNFSHGCEMDGVANWLVPQQLNILDVFRGEIFGSNTNSITGINQVNVNQVLNKGPYFDFVAADSRFTIRTNDAYIEYEEHEIETSISFTVLFNCAGGTTRSMVFVIDITDTNNNDPIFGPTTDLEFTVVPPLPPGFQITGCWNDIYARDIDLTTQRVDFEIYDSPYFEIEYDKDSSTVPKQFKATLKTTTFIRSISEPIEFRISATDVDLTNDPRRTTYTTVRIKSDGEFELPEEPTFSQPFYRATYTEDHQVVLEETISLRQGYHAEVEFSLGPDYTEYFTLVEDSNKISIRVVNQLSAELLTLQQLILVVNAERNHTSGASATVILQLPEEEALDFQQASYEGNITDNVLQLSELLLAQGYEGDPVTVDIISEHSAFFSSTTQQNRITLAMTPLPSNVIEQNSFLNLQIVASTNRTSATTIVTLEIVKDDGVTPVFQRTLYEGTYDADDGLTLEQIVMVQGYDDTVLVTLQGEHKAFFQIDQNGPLINLTALSIPRDLYSQGTFILTLEATKPRTVGANTAISISLPAETQLEFEQQNYEGIIEDNILQLTQLILTQGYDKDPVSVYIENGTDHTSYFTATIQDNRRIIISMSPLPAEVIQLNTFVNLQVVALTEWSSASTIVTLEIIKDDTITPVFENGLYEGTYDPLYGLTLNEIMLVQGYDDTVRVNLRGDHASYFETVQEGRYINLSVSSLPETLFSERTVLLSIEATKPRTVGANAAISISLPADREMRFAAEIYTGTVRDNNLTLESIELSVGYTDNVTFTLSGDYVSYFDISYDQNQISLALREQLSNEITTENNFLAFTLTASAPNAITTSTTIILEIVQEDTNTPRFNQDIFFGTYTDNNLEVGPINLTQGYDGTVLFRLDGEFAQYFGISNANGNNVIITVPSPIPREVIFDEKVLTFSVIAEKELTVGAVAAVSIKFPTELTHPTALRFSKNIYVGSLDGNTVGLEDVILEHGLTASTEFKINGDYSSYFTYKRTENGVSISITNTLPSDVLDHKYITLELEARDLRAVPVTTVIIIDVTQPDPITPPVFNEAYYRGVYTVETDLQFEEEIYLSEGFDETVNFTLAGEFSQWFDVSQTDNLVTIITTSRLPEEILENQNNLLFTIVATKLENTTGRSVIFIDLPKEVPAPLVISFSQASYVGQIVEGSLDLPPVTLIGGYDMAIHLNATGEFASYFTLSRESNVVSISMNSSLPSGVVEENAFILLDIEASYPEAVNGYTTVVFELVKESSTQIVTPVFEQAYYTGQYTREEGLLFEQTIQLIQGYDKNISITLVGDDAEAFKLVENDTNNFTLSLKEGVIENLNNRHQLVFSVVASKPESLPGQAAIIITLADLSPARSLRFAQDYYTGSINNGNLILSQIVLEEGYSVHMQYSLRGDYNDYFQVTQQEGIFTVQLINESTLPVEIINNTSVIILTLEVQLENSRAHTSIILNLLQNDPIPLQFDSTYYVGTYTVSGGLNFNNLITLENGYDDTVQLSLEGDLAEYFTATAQGAAVSIVLRQPIPQESIPSNGVILLELQASAPPALPAVATIVLEVVRDDDAPIPPVFAETFYVGSYSANGSFVFDSEITLAQGYDSTVTFELVGEQSQWFDIFPSGNSVRLTLSSAIPGAVLANNQQLIFAITAQRPGSTNASATIIVQLNDEITVDEVLGFNRVNYVGSLVENTVDLGPIILSGESSSAVTLSLHGNLAEYFTATAEGAAVSIVLRQPIPQESIPSNGVILLELQASAPPALPAVATIMLEVVRDDDVPIPLVFAETFYVGSYSANGSFVFDSKITLAQGYDSTVTFELVGEQSQWFDIFPSGNSVRLTLSSAIPGAVLANNQQLIFAITAERPGNMTVRATIIVQLIDDDSSVIFDKVLYEGIIQSGVVQHATITVSGYEGTDIELAGVYASMFRASLSNGIVVVEAAGSLTLPADLNHLALELRVENAGAVLILQILATDGPVLPTVSFDSGSYALRVELGQTGTVGQVRATADNGEDVTYTLDVDNEHLRSRISINNAGELRLSAPANSGTYSFQAVATTVFSQARGSSTIHFLVDTLTVEKTAGNPLIVLDRNEEEPLRDLVTLNAVEHAGCRYTMTNRWPANQNWLYVDETGLHATAIDREDPSIAFMALSQIKVELTLSCEDDRARTKRSTGERLDWLGPYDYGTNTWLLGETIIFNPRKSIVNLIVNDINDNAPIFVGVENQPIIVGYPISELEETVLPRSLAELQATDADIGENAALVYWSSEPELAVSPTTGFVHVRNDQRLEEDKILTVSATDLNGNGHTGSITLMVKLLDSSNIAVITVRGAFLEDERHILGNLSNTIGYEVKALRSIVVSEAEEEPVSRMKRDIATEGASLEIYVYGLIQREPVAVETMITDINNAAVVPVNIANIQSLQDYIDGRLICEDPGRDTGLLVATIVLSVLLLILIVAIIVWFVLKRIRKPNYEEFSDTTSSVSQNDALGQTPKPLDSVAVAKPRLNIEELKRSERRLQDMLNAPINDVVVEPSTSNANNELNSVTKIPLPDPMAPIVIQDKLKDAVEESDDDEFGERKKARRKSVVTFNENVEKIIHVDEEPDVIADPNYEVYKL